MRCFGFTVSVLIHSFGFTMAQRAIEKSFHNRIIGFTQTFSRAVGEDAPFMEQRQAMSDFERAGEIVCDDNAGHAKRALQHHNQIIDRVTADRIQSGCGFIIQQNLRIEHDGARQCDAFALPAGQFSRHFSKRLTHADEFQDFAHALMTFVSLDCGVLHERVRHVVLDVHRIKKGALLKQKADLSAQGCESLFAERVDALVVHPHLAGIWLEQADEMFEHDALAAPAWAEHDVGPAGMKVQRNAAQHVLGIKRLMQVDESNARWGAVAAAERLVPVFVHGSIILWMSEVSDVKTTHDGRLFRVEIVQAADKDGRIHQREVVRHPGAVLIVPVLENDRVVLIVNQRIAVQKKLWELPAGKLEPGEPPDRAAARELAEETGYTAQFIRPLGRFYTSPGFADEQMHVFVAERLTPGNQQLDAGEEIEVQAITVDQALAMIDDHRIEDGKTIAALLMWDRQRHTAGSVNG